jgi:hypothetical protein
MKFSLVVTRWAVSKKVCPENLARPIITGLPKLAIRIEAAAKVFRIFYENFVCQNIK